MTTFRATVAEIARIVGSTLSPDAADSRVVEEIATDTRQLPSHAFAFVALKGPNFDGDAFAEHALDAGAAAVVVSSDVASRPGAGAVIRVPDGLAALQALAAWWRDRFSGAVVGITGSNGKTTVKEMSKAILARSRAVYDSPGSYNSQVGVALSLLRAPEDADVYLVECGVSRPGEMSRLQSMVRPDLGVLTNAGTAHLAGFGSTERIAREKLSLFKEMNGTLVLHESAAPYADARGECPTVTVGRGPDAELRIVDTRPTASGHRVTLSRAGQTLSFDLPSHAEHDADNAACAAALAQALGVPDPERGIEAYTPVPLRIEVHTSPFGSGVTLINDSYSADPLSMRSALKTLARLSRDRRSIAVLGEMKDLGADSERRHRQAGALAAELAVDRLIAVGEGTRPLIAGALDRGMTDDQVTWVPGAEACAEVLDGMLAPGDVVLVKASRPLHLERTAEYLLESISPTRAYIDLGVIADNVRRLRSWLKGDVGLIAVVKSFGYGSDVVRVSDLLQTLSVDYLAVAYPDEGVLLRRRGIHMPILVTGFPPSEAEKLADHRLTAVVYSREQVDALSAVVGSGGRPIPVHLKVDTGMGRFGVDAGEALAFADLVENRRGLDIEGVMSHLAAADDPAQDEYTALQIERFARIVRDLQAAGISPRYVHLANSAGTLRFPEAHFNAVRVGLGLYGCLDEDLPTPGAPDLLPAISLHSRLVGIRQLPAGQSIGYGRRFTTTRPTRMGLVGLGYNDGLPWSVSGRGALWVRGRRAPILGSVCMDVTMIDLSEVPEAQVGDDVVVYGTGEEGRPTVPEVARWAGTIPYEILCRLSPRVRRVIRLAV